MDGSDLKHSVTNQEDREQSTGYGLYGAFSSESSSFLTRKDYDINLAFICHALKRSKYIARL